VGNLEVEVQKDDIQLSSSSNSIVCAKLGSSCNYTSFGNRLPDTVPPRRESFTFRSKSFGLSIIN